VRGAGAGAAYRMRVDDWIRTTDAGMFSMRRTGWLLLFLLCGQVSSAWAALSCTFAWDVPTQGTPQGYRLYSTLVSGNYTHSTPVPTGNVLTFTTPCQRGQFWVVRAVDPHGESGNSNEVRVPSLGVPRALKHPVIREGP